MTLKKQNQSKTINKLRGSLRQSLLALGLGVTLSPVALANNDIALGVPAYGGTGCPAGTASVTLSPDAKALSILFDNYVAEAGPSSRKTIDRKSCNIAVPVHVPQGYSVAVLSVDYRGFTMLPRGAQARFNVEYFFAGSRGPITTRNFIGPTNSDYLINNRLVAESVVWSACGADVNLRANTSMLLTNNTRQDALATVDSADVQAGIVYHLMWRRCL